MGYTHGNRWNDEKIEKEIRYVMEQAKIDTFPTRRICKEVTNNEALIVAISKRGGTKYWANKLGISIANSESKFGQEYESKCFSFLTNKGYDCETTSVKYPYDILVNRNIKVDVKSSRLYKGVHGDYYTFNLEKTKPTCDIFVCYCIDNETNIAKVYVIPSCQLSGKSQLSLGVASSKYDKFIDQWEWFEIYDKFYKSVLEKC